MNVTLDDYRWLVSEAAAPWLDDAYQARDPSVQLINRLRKDLSAEKAHLVVEQVELRRRARDKFSQAERMFFTRRGLEQATDERLADYKAARFPAGAVVNDLCCGIGGDLIALARRGAVTGVDLDPVSLLFAEANVRVAAPQALGCAFKAADAAQVEIGDGIAWHCDPDRRIGGHRTTSIEYFSPTMEALAALLRQQPSAAIKLAPATQSPSRWADSCELEWLGSRGECRQQVAWFGSLARYPGQRAATLVEAHAVRTVVGKPTDEIPVAAACGRYLYEPHAAVLAANLTAALCQEHALAAALSPAIAYLTSDAAIVDPAIDAFTVQDLLPFDRKRLKAYCREHRIGRVEVKKRGVDVDPNRLARELASNADESATILLAPIAGKVTAIVTSRIKNP